MSGGSSRTVVVGGRDNKGVALFCKVVRDGGRALLLVFIGGLTFCCEDEDGWLLFSTMFVG